jgi:hypothetical protein
MFKGFFLVMMHFFTNLFGYYGALHVKDAALIFITSVVVGYLFIWICALFYKEVDIDLEQTQEFIIVRTIGNNRFAINPDGVTGIVECFFAWVMMRVFKVEKGIEYKSLKRAMWIITIVILILLFISLILVTNEYMPRMI